MCVLEASFLPNYASIITHTEADSAQLQLNPMIGDVEFSLALALHVGSNDRYVSKMFLIDRVNLVFTAFGFVGETTGAHAGNGKQVYGRGICAHVP